MENSLSPIKRAALAVLDYLKDLVVNDCSDEDVTEAMVKFHPSVNKDYFNPKDYVNYDEACQILHLGNNRGKLNILCKTHGIVNVTVKNRPLGFKRSEILRLNDIINKEGRR